MIPPKDRFKRVDEYARERALRLGDVYGWAILPVTSNAETRDEVVLLVAEKADLASFPRQIGGYKVRLRRVPEPEPQSVGR